MWLCKITSVSTYVTLVVVALNTLLWSWEHSSPWSEGSENPQEGVSWNTFQAPYLLKEQPTAVSSVVTSLLLLGHESFPSAPPALKGIPFICRGSGPSIRKQMVTFPPLCSDYFFVISRFVTDWPFRREDGRQRKECKKCTWNGLALIVIIPCVLLSVLCWISVNPRLYKMVAVLT